MRAVTETHFVRWIPIPEFTNMAGLENQEFSIGDTSSNGWFSIVMLVFRGVLRLPLMSQRI